MKKVRKNRVIVRNRDNFIKYCKNKIERNTQRPRCNSGKNDTYNRKMKQNSLLKFIYRTTKRCNDEDYFETVREAVPKGCEPKGKLADMRAAWVLSLMFSIQGPITKATRNKIRLLAFALDYALEKKVPRWLLTGFIHQVGGLKAIEKIYVAKLKS